MFDHESSTDGAPSVDDHNTEKKQIMKKAYIKPEITIEDIEPESMLSASNDHMGSVETPGTDDDFNANGRRGTWGNLWATPDDTKGCRW